jgi:hypothetical protein
MCDLASQRACDVADKSADELEAALLKLAASTEETDAERDAELGALTDAVTELRAQTATATDVETLARYTAVLCDACASPAGAATAHSC